MLRYQSVAGRVPGQHADHAITDVELEVDHPGTGGTDEPAPRFTDLDGTLIGISQRR